MKILCYVRSLGAGGMERVMSVLCNEFVIRGHEVILCTDITSPIAYSIDKSITIVDKCSKGGRNRNRIIAKFFIYRNFRQIAKQLKPDVIISFIEPIHLFCNGLKIPVIVSWHNTFHYPKDAYKMRWYNKLYTRYLYRFADKITWLTQDIYDDAIKYCSNYKKNSVVMPNPLSFPIIENNTHIRKKTILACGLLPRWKVKGFDNLIKIWANIADKYLDWTLEIAGEGRETDFDYLKALAKEYGIENRINFLGLRKDMDKVMRESSIFCLSSRLEGLPMVLTEAMSQGCCCVSFDIKSGPNTIITDGFSGILVEKENNEKMADVLSKLIEDEELRITLSNNGLKDVAKFSISEICDKWEELFRKVIAEKKKIVDNSITK